MSEILWQPSVQREQQANIIDFISRIEQQGVGGFGDYDYATLYQWTISYPQDFWSKFWDYAGIIAETKGDLVVIDFEKMPGARWFPEARLNYAENLLAKGQPQQPAILFVNETGQITRISFQQLRTQVAQLARALRAEGVVVGDRVTAVMPNRPETVIAMLAVTSIGAVWSSCSPDFGISGIIDRFGQIQAKILFIVDGYTFKGKRYDCLDKIEPLLDAMPSIKTTILVPCLDTLPVLPLTSVRLWADYLATSGEASEIEFTQVAFDAPLFIMFSSGTTGPPKCIVHSVGGTLIQHLKEHLLHVDIHPSDRLFYYTSCAWMMWNWLVSGLASGATLVLYDGAPLYPHEQVLFDLVDRLQINVFGVSAKYIDVLRKSEICPRRSHNLDSLETILSTGSPLMPESFNYVYQSIKADVCLSSISGGTDIISCFVLGCPVLPVRSGEIQCRGLAMQVEVFDDEGQSLSSGKGELVCTAPFPAMPIGFWDDPEQRKYRAAYFDKYPGVWCHGDYVALTESNGMIVYGRSDAVLNPGGIRIGSAEIYRQVEQLDQVLESLVVGQGVNGDCRVILFVVLRPGIDLTDALQAQIKQQIKRNVSPHHVPTLIIKVDDIPRTKSGKIVELAVRKIFNGQEVQNLQGLANPEVLIQYRNIAESLKTIVI